MGFKLFWGIIRYPFKRLYEMCYRKTENEILAKKAEGRRNYKCWLRMHDMSSVTNTAYTESELYGKIGTGNFIPC